MNNGIYKNFKKEMKRLEKESKITRNDRVRMKQFEKKQQDFNSSFSQKNYTKTNILDYYDNETGICRYDDCIWQVRKDKYGKEYIGFITTNKKSYSLI